MKNRMKLTINRDGRELQAQATYNEVNDDWVIETRRNRSDDFRLYGTTRNVWATFARISEDFTK